MEGDHHDDNETTAGAARSHEITGPRERSSHRLGDRHVLGVDRQLIDDLAIDRRFMRRLLAEGRYPPGGMRGPSLSGDARRVEVPELGRFPVNGDFLAAIAAWAGEPDELGWPRENTSTPTGRELFRVALSRDCD